MHQGKTDLAGSDATSYTATNADPFHPQRVGRKAGVELKSDCSLLLGGQQPTIPVSVGGGLTESRCPQSLVRPEGAKHLWRRVPPSELSIELVANGRRGRATGSAEAP